MMLQKQQKYCLSRKSLRFEISMLRISVFNQKQQNGNVNRFFRQCSRYPLISRFFIDSRIFTFFSFFCANLTFDRKKNIFKTRGGYLIHRRKKKLTSRFSIFFQNKCILVYWEFNFFSKICFFSCFFSFFLS